MPTLYDEEGNPVDGVFTQEELREATEKAKEEARLNDEERQRLEKLEKKDFNFEQLRKKKEREEDPEKKEEPKETPKEPQLDTDLDDLVNKVDDTLTEGERKKAAFYFNGIARNITDPVLREEFMKDAVAMATKQRVDGGGGFKSGGGRTYAPKDRDTRSPEAQAIARGLGVSEEDRKAYGKDWKPKYVNPPKIKTT